MLPHYATDLLHAHQIRRENVFLHKELEACRGDHTEIQSAIKRIQVGCNSSNDHARQAHDLTTIHQRQLQDQAQLISCLQDTNEALQNEFMILSKAFAQFGYTEQQKRAELESKVKKLEEGATEAAETLVQNTTKVWKEIDALGTIVEAKAEGGLVDLLVDRLNNLGSIPRSPLASTSCIVESIEQPGPTSSEIGRSNSPRQLSVDSTGYSEIQVEDSQKLAIKKIEKKERVNNVDLKQYKDQRATQSPDDVDLDANAPTISYGGHYYPGKNKPHEEDSLRMLPELSVQASRLAMINTLMQGRYENWRIYHDRGAVVKDSLPQTFEAAIVQRFVEGIFGAKQRAQCVQWLSDEGWKWDNVTRFGNLCSQIDDGSRPEDDSMSSNESRATATYDVVRDKLDGLQPAIGADAPRKLTQPVKRSKWSVTTLRRSQRLIERSQTKLKEMNGTTDSAFSRSHSQDNGQPSRHVEQNVVLNQSENAIEISGGCIVSERHRQGNSETSTRFEDEDSETSRTEMLSDVQTANNVSLGHSQGVDGLPSRLSLSLPPLKRTRTQSLEQAGGGQKRTKNQYLPLPTPPEIPILPTSTDE